MEQRRMLPNYLNSEAFHYLDKRDSAVQTLRTKGHWESRQRIVRKTLLASMGDFPERTPLNPQITGVLQRDGFRIEKIIFESMPQYYVSGCLFIPDKIVGKRPGWKNKMRIARSEDSALHDIFRRPLP